MARPTALRTCSALLLALLFAACGESEPTTRPPHEVVRAFFDALIDGDVDRCEPFLSTRARAGLAGGRVLFVELGAERMDACHVKEAVIRGDEATVDVTARVGGTKQRSEIRLRSEEGRWRIYAFGVRSNGSLVSFDLERPEAAATRGKEKDKAKEFALSRAFAEVLAELDAGGSAGDIARERRRYGDLQAVSRDEHDGAWPIDVFAGGRSAREVLFGIVEPTGTRIDEGLHAARFDGTSDVALGGVSRLEAIEAVCAELGLFPVYPDTHAVFGDEVPAITFREGPRSFAVAFEGPFMFEVEELEERAPYATGRLTLCVRAFGLDPAVVAANADLGPVVHVWDVRSPAGKSLLVPGEGRVSDVASCVDGLFESRTTLELRGLLNDVDELASIDGEVALFLPERVVQLGFAPANLVPESTVRARGWAATLLEVGTDTAVELRGTSASNESTRVRFAPDDARGTPVGIRTQRATMMLDHVLFEATAAAPPHALALKVFNGPVHTVPFHLDAIPLARFDEQPLELEPLLVIGPDPLGVEFVGFDDVAAGRTQARLQVVNHANKIVLSADATLEFLDYADVALATTALVLRGELGFDGHAPLARPGAPSYRSVPVELPAGVDSMRVRVSRVSFVDGTAWEPAGATPR
jgi:hypothetical protein